MMPMPIAGAEPGEPLGHVPAVGADGLPDEGDGGVLNAVARHVAEALGADGRGCWPRWPPCRGRETMRTRSTCAEERAARSAASGAPTRQRLRRQARGDAASCRGCGWHSGLVPQQQDAPAPARPPMMVERAVPSAAPGTSEAGTPDIVTLWPNSTICRVGLMRKKLKTTSSTQTSTLMRLGVRASPVARSMAAYIPMAMREGEGRRPDGKVGAEALACEDEMSAPSHPGRKRLMPTPKAASAADPG